MNLKDCIKQKAIELGFDLAGVTSAGPIDTDSRRYFLDWLQQGCAAWMDYLGRNIEKRLNPAELLEGAQSVICVALNYRPEKEIPAGPCRIANYALYEDYHVFIKDRLYQLADFIRDLAGADKHIQTKVCVDSAPVLERSLANRAGLGFIGKNHMLIHPRLGGQLLLGELFTKLPLPPDEPMEAEFCQNCDACVKACPCGALNSNGNFDSRMCLSYQTIENKSDIDDTIYKKIKGRLFGCDNCLLACPYEKDAPPAGNKEFRLFVQNNLLTPEQIADWQPEDFDAAFKNTPVHRLGLERLKRNARICGRHPF